MASPLTPQEKALTKAIRKQFGDRARSAAVTLLAAECNVTREAAEAYMDEHDITFVTPGVVQEAKNYFSEAGGVTTPTDMEV